MQERGKKGKEKGKKKSQDGRIDERKQSRIKQGDKNSIEQYERLVNVHFMVAKRKKERFLKVELK